MVDQTVAAIQHHLPTLTWQPVLIHGDSHPGNTLWHQSRLTGIVDWTGSRLGPSAYELARCRADIALLLDPGAADRLRHHYAAVASTTPTGLPVFDLVWGLDNLRKTARILTAYRQQGRTDTAQQFTDRAAAFLRHTLAELGAP